MVVAHPSIRSLSTTNHIAFALSRPHMSAAATVPLSPTAALLRQQLDLATGSRNFAAPPPRVDWPTLLGFALSGRAGTRSSDAAGSWPALHAAALHSKPAYTSALLAAGAPPDARAPGCGRTALHVAVGAARWRPDAAAATALALLRGGADVDARCAAGKTPLIEAVSTGCEELVDMLLAAGADVSATAPGRDERGERLFDYSALYLALYTNRQRIVEMLLSAGATALTDKSDPTVESLAETFDDVRALLQHL